MVKGRKLTAKETREKLESDISYRKEVFKELLAHVRAGYSMDCFPQMSEVSIRAYLKAYSNEFVQEDLDNALREGKQNWETIGKRQATGDCLGNSRSWYYNMSNRYGWSDKQKIEAEHTGSVAINIVSYATNKRDKDAVDNV